MFFGAGNVVFPLAVGQVTGAYIYYALFGLFFTAVLVPFIGLHAATLLDGCHKSFFSPLGRYGGFLLAAAILCLLGPFGVIPRCIALSQETFHMYFPYGNALTFNIISCVLILILTLKKNRIVSLLGNLMTPILIGVLYCIIFVGLFYVPDTAPLPAISAGKSFMLGLTEGYQTMDLLAGLFFASFITIWMREHMPAQASPTEKKQWMKISAMSITIAAILIASVYVGFGILAARFTYALEGVPQAQLLGTIAGEVLGMNAGLIVCVAVCLACLTTAISLAGIFAEFVRKDVAKNKISYEAALVFTVVVTFGFSMLEFNGIVAFLQPILSVCYPGLILLTGYNLFRYYRKPKMSLTTQESVL
jgi:LIVCS family branched-chain amino acid:cation transporter